MPKENDINESSNSEEISTPQEGEQLETSEQPELLSRRDAIEVAYEGLKEKETPTPVEEEPAPVHQASPELPPLRAPAEWNKEEKADFETLSRKQQEAAIRLHRARNSSLEEIKRNKQEYDYLRKLSDNVTPFVKALGVKDSADVAIQKALTMWHEFEHGDPKQAAAAYLRAKGLEVPIELLEESQEKNQNQAILPLQEKLNAIESRLASADLAREREVISSNWTTFVEEKNATGGLKYPDVDDSESGLRLASNIGSLVGGKTELSKQFIAMAQARIPDLTYSKLIAEAYKYCGGRVDEATPAKNQKSQQEHIKQARRASASVMPRGSSSNGGTERKNLSRREALALALAEIREREGN